MITLTESGQDLLVVQQVLNGDKSAYEKIIKRYNTQLYRVGIAFLGKENGVEDAMQNAYLKAYYNLSQFKGNAAFSTWLIRIMINECKLAIRKKQTKERLISNGNKAKQSSITKESRRCLCKKK